MKLVHMKRSITIPDTFRTSTDILEKPLDPETEKRDHLI